LKQANSKMAVKYRLEKVLAILTNNGKMAKKQTFISNAATVVRSEKASEINFRSLFHSSRINL